MVSKVFTVYDSKAEAYLTPFLMRTKSEAIRGFQDVCNDDKSNFCKYAEDYTLFEIGEFDDSIGTYTMYASKVSLGCAIEYKRMDALSIPPKMPTGNSKVLNLS